MATNAEILAQFREWSGGFLPSQCSIGQRKTWVELGCYCEQDEAEEFLGNFEEIETDEDADETAKGLDEQKALWVAHEQEAEREGAEFHNFGWGESEGSICSKTNKGKLQTDANGDGTYSHIWLD